jgi:predicted enzyme related to lactoylglutathione lyase
MADIDATLSRVEANGGKTVTGRTEIAPGMGSTALFADPLGNRLGLYEPAS